MRFYFDTSKVPLELSKLLEKQLTLRKQKISLGNCQEILAYLFGFNSYNEHHRTCALLESTMPDRYVERAELNKRAVWYIAALMEYDFTFEEAADLIHDSRAGPWLGILLLPEPDRVLFRRGDSNSDLISATFGENER